MALINDVKDVCDRLAPLGWRDLLLTVTEQKLDISKPTAAALAAELRKSLPEIDRRHPGFEDFSLDGKQGITPGSPARSLFYHALASPNVFNDASGVRLQGFPTLREIEVVENYVFGVKPPTLTELLQRTHVQRLTPVIFACEYRPAKDSCSRLQADLAFSRTGIARVGTTAALYDSSRRGFWAEDPGNPFGIRVLPAHYVVYLAVRRKGDAAQFLPMRFQNQTPGTNPGGDASLDFWVPVHKLFDGTECLRGLDLKVQFRASHINEKIRRIRISLGQTNPPTTSPFRLTDGIAEFATDRDLGQGVLVPVPHGRLVEPAIHNGQPLTFKVPKNNNNSFAAYEPGTTQDSFGEVRPVPAYVHARTEIKNGISIDLNNDSNRPDVRKTVRAGNYEALHYIDFTGDGQIMASCDGLAGQAGVAAKALPAYSIVAAPDFFPLSGQRELTEWTTSREVPASLRQNIWAIPPAPLCDVRLPANLQMPNHSFDSKEKTVSTVVPLFGTSPSASEPPFSQDAIRHSCLPDDAAGVFAPGWDISHDRLRRGSQTFPHLAAYGLGSPFPEDAKLCAALSAFWPTVAPDISRGMEPNPNPGLRATIAPLTDEEIGQVGNLPWDGIPGPKLITHNGQLFAECESFLHADYVESALERRFSLRLTARVTPKEYAQRVLAMSLTYLGLGGDRDTWFVLSFGIVSPGNPEFQQAQDDARVVLPSTVYRCDIFRIDSANPSLPSPASFRRKLLPINDRRFLFVDPGNRLILQRRDNQPRWSQLSVPV